MCPSLLGVNISLVSTMHMQRDPTAGLNIISVISLFNFDQLSLVFWQRIKAIDLRNTNVLFDRRLYQVDISQLNLSTWNTSSNSCIDGFQLQHKIAVVSLYRLSTISVNPQGKRNLRFYHTNKSICLVIKPVAKDLTMTQPYKINLKRHFCPWQWLAESHNPCRP